MPYKRVGKCVYKKNADDTKGDKVGCSDNEEAAKAYLKKLYSVEEVVREELQNYLQERKSKQWMKQKEN